MSGHASSDSSKHEYNKSRTQFMTFVRLSTFCIGRTLCALTDTMQSATQHRGKQQPEAGDVIRKASREKYQEEDARLTVRYPLHLPVSFHWVDEQGLPREWHGCTRDIGPKGAYILASLCPAVAATIRMVLHLPVPAENGRVIEVETKGRVLRVDLEHDSGCCSGFSVFNERVTL
jgi:hypothetical protein